MLQFTAQIRGKTKKVKIDETNARLSNWDTLLIHVRINNGEWRTAEVELTTKLMRARVYQVMDNLILLLSPAPIPIKPREIILTDNKDIIEKLSEVVLRLREKRLQRFSEFVKTYKQEDYFTEEKTRNLQLGYTNWEEVSKLKAFAIYLTKTKGD
jgi:hypothetical protein